MEFHIRRDLRDRLALDDVLFGYTGNVVFANVAASRKLAQQLNTVRDAENDPDRLVNAGALFAMGLIDELNHALIAKYRREMDPQVLRDALVWLAGKIEKTSSQSLERLLLKFTEIFPGVSVYRGEQTAAEWLSKATEGMPNREAALEELLLLWLANQNPALKSFKELFADGDLGQGTAYTQVTGGFPDYFKTRPPVAAELGSLLDVLRAPMLASPESLTGQLDYIRTHWSDVLGADLKRVLLAIDTLREEDIAIWMRFNPAKPDWYRHGAPGRGGEGFVGDEYVGFEDEWTTDAQGRRVRRYAAGYQAPLNEYEAFSADQAWMPNVVMMAKSTYVWLEQLSKKYGRHIHRLDHVPEEELALMADQGITSLWLIGLWERSIASRTIKHLRGHTDAVASAYSLKDYTIAGDLGGYEAYERLKQAAARHRIRLASDMVPNHMGIDSPWVIENPEAFLYRWESPYPSYSFNGPDLSTDSRVEIKLEDHYYDQSDAAVVFRIHHHGDGATRYMYHGNDGTTFAWNDTAQLDYSKAWVREQVMQTILHVARMFPIIRFDAAMVLAKRHVQRLWFPLPGAGGSIPSRAESAMSDEEFNALMPHEFWREVVDRVAVEVPGTLLLAEAFWMLEGYFVRTLGMHRVYNSAFMNMLRDEENAKYRSYLKKTIEFDPDILKRYVNFMSNPDERTTIDQFGSGDKCFGVATLMSTLPGLPMFGHGQIEGYGERYGMEFKQAKMDERPNEGLVARHQAEIAPLLKKRYIFAESANFVLYDFWGDNGAVDENVFAYSNNFYGERSLIFYNNSYGSRRGTIHNSAASMDKGSGQLRQRSLADGLALPWDDALFVAYRDHTNGLEYIRRANDFHRNGMTLDLRGYQYAVLLDWRELRSTAEYPWEPLCDSLNGAGVYSLDESLKRLRLRPLHEAMRAVLAPTELEALGMLAEEECAKPMSGELEKDVRVVAFAARAKAFFEQVKVYLPGASVAKGESCEALLAAALRLPTLERGFSTAWPSVTRKVVPSEERSVLAWAPVLAWVLLHSAPLGASPVVAFDSLGLREALAEVFTAVGLEGERVWQAAAMVRLLLATKANAVASETFWQDGDVRWLVGANEHDGVTYVNQERFEEVLCWLAVPELVAGQVAAAETFVTGAAKAMNAAGYDAKAFLRGEAVAVPVTSVAKKAVAKSAAKKAPAKRSTKVASTDVGTTSEDPKAETLAAKKPAAKKTATKKSVAKKAAVKKPKTS
ncbi:MAG: alpha-amylase family glycosyl hydrolase [Acidobacteriaceae bacterium]|nr:alpha-amylase family glycosyl hydrolase [Acidobacteriaceae bacterium]